MTGPRYELLPADRPADDLEQELLALWREERLFERTLLERADSPRFVFYDGPPTARSKPAAAEKMESQIGSALNRCSGKCQRQEFVGSFARLAVAVEESVEDAN